MKYEAAPCPKLKLLLAGVVNAVLKLDMNSTLGGG